MNRTCPRCGETWESDGGWKCPACGHAYHEPALVDAIVGHHPTLTRDYDSMEDASDPDRYAGEFRLAMLNLASAWCRFLASVWSVPRLRRFGMGDVNEHSAARYEDRAARLAHRIKERSL